MDIAGAEALRWRIAQQEHWETATAVRVGVQPAIDPDGYLLESYSAGVRTYRAKRLADIVDGRPALVSCHLTKRLVEGAWYEDVFLGQIEHVA
jgi:hypothetical protein